VQNTTRCRMASLPLVLTAHTRSLSLPSPPLPPPPTIQVLHGVRPSARTVRP
jgi:hypothetical protein